MNVTINPTFAAHADLAPTSFIMEYAGGSYIPSVMNDEQAVESH
jgi:hypothetical protein